MIFSIHFLQQKYLFSTYFAFIHSSLISLERNVLVIIVLIVPETLLLLSGQRIFWKLSENCRDMNVICLEIHVFYLLVSADGL
jgi:hypothetical protein